MFAVPGWSVSADSLKAETQNQGGGASGSKSKKRKRNNNASEAEIVTASNVADLFESVVEGKSKEPKSKKQDNSGADEKSRDKPSKQKKNKKTSQDDGEVTKTPHTTVEKKQKKGKGDKEQAQKPSDDNPPAKKAKKAAKAGNSDTVAQAAPPPPLPPAPSKLTPLQAAMRQKLISARFRHLNETLYTRESTEAYKLFDESPEMFDEYHEGFRRQVKVWPENPVDNFLQDIRSRAKVRTPGRGAGKPGRPPPPPQESQGGVIPLPRTAGTCIIADLGCGDARLAASLQADKDKMRLDVRSYDLQSLSPLVIKADIANLPLADGSVNVAVFCLALMGTNWVDFIEEAYRVLHWKGELWIAEIKSRFALPRGKAGGPVGHSVGNRRKQPPAPAGKKAKKGAHADPDDEEDLAVEVDGMDDRRRETDVSAFVEVLKARGFVLQGEPRDAVNMSNKMFVKMNFIKAAAPTKGKGVKEAEQRRPVKGAAKWPNGRDEPEEGTEMDEASILKPCVYKIR